MRWESGEICLSSWYADPNPAPRLVSYRIIFIRLMILSILAASRGGTGPCLSTSMISSISAELKFSRALAFLPWLAAAIRNGTSSEGFFLSPLIGQALQQSEFAFVQPVPAGDHSSSPCVIPVHLPFRNQKLPARTGCRPGIPPAWRKSSSICARTSRLMSWSMVPRVPGPQNLRMSLSMLMGSTAGDAGGVSQADSSGARLGEQVHRCA